ncbi:MAG: PQQ-binding-like beta-propeller repeat protein, partial [Acidimicrobiales bacterium]
MKLKHGALVAPAVVAVGAAAFALFSATHAARPVAADAMMSSEAYAPVTAERLDNANTENGWLMYLHGYNSNAHVAFTQINTSNVGQLKEVFTHDVDIPNGFEAPPIVNGRTMIVTTPLDHVYAVDAVTGKELWHYDYPYAKIALRTVCCDVVNRGVALWGNNAYMATLDNHVVALNARTGAVVWDKTLYPDPGVGYFMTVAPLAVNGSIIVGDGGGEYGARGFIEALDAGTGAMKWRTYTVPSPTEPGGNTWPGETYKHGGGNAWVTGSYDPETNTLFWGVGNPGPWLSDLRKGKNLYTDSILAMDASTGKIKWYFQETPNDPWDYDAVNTPALADVMIDGTMRKVVYTAARNGWFIVLDRTNGKLIWAKPFTKA